MLGNSIDGKYAIGFLIVLLIGKMIATSLTIGIGGSGGVFAPSLFIGAMLGSAYGQILHHLMPGVAGSAGAYALIGMGAVFAGAARAPITAVIIMFELTGEYTIILPLMVAIVLATGISHLLTGDSIYTLKLRRRGIDLSQSPESAAMATITVGTIMEPVRGRLADTTTMLDAANALSRAPHGQLPVLDDHGRYRGIVTAHAVADALADGEHDQQTIAAIVEFPTPVSADDHLEHALDILDDADGAIPVLDADHHSLVGWLTHQRVLVALRRPTEPLTPASAPPTDHADASDSAAGN